MSQLRQRYPDVFEADIPRDRVEPLAWLTDVLERMISDRTRAHKLEQLLPWTWKAEQAAVAGDA